MLGHLWSGIIQWGRRRRKSGLRIDGAAAVTFFGRTSGPSASWRVDGWTNIRINSVAPWTAAGYTRARFGGDLFFQGATDVRLSATATLIPIPDPRFDGYTRAVFHTITLGGSPGSGGTGVTTSYQFTIKVTDANGATSSVSCTIALVSATVVPTTVRGRNMVWSS